MATPQEELARLLRGTLGVGNQEVLAANEPVSTGMPDWMVNPTERINFASTTPPASVETPLPPITETVPPEAPFTPPIDPSIGANLALQRQMLSQFKKQQGSLEGDVDTQREFLKALLSQKTTANQAPTLESLYTLAGRSPASIKESLAAVKPEDTGDFQDRLRKLLGDVTGGQDKISDNLVNQLRVKMSMGDTAKQGRFERAQSDRAFKDVKKSFDAIDKDVREYNQAIGGVNAAISSGEVGQISQSIAKLAQTQGHKGVLSDTDIKNAVPGSLPNDVAKIRAYLSGDQTVKISDGTVKALAKYIQANKKVFDQKISDWIDTEKEMYEGSGAWEPHANRLADKAKKLISKREEISKEQKAAPSGKKKAVKDMNEAELDAYLAGGGNG